MKLVTYNIHYGIGKDAEYNLRRVVDGVRGADIVALQEVERNFGPGRPNQPEELGNLLPEYYWVYAASFDVDDSERRADGVIVNRRRQHGVMLMSKWPILSKRSYCFPRVAMHDFFNMQKGMLEGVIETPLGAVRIYVVHFGPVDPEERAQQSRFLLDIIRDAPARGGAWTGPADIHPDRDFGQGMPVPPMPAPAIVIGDFNMEPGTREYDLLMDAADEDGSPIFLNAWSEMNPGRTVHTWHPMFNRNTNETSMHLDYCLLPAVWKDRLHASWIDEVAQGSDHQPLWVELKVLGSEPNILSKGQTSVTRC